MNKTNVVSDVSALKQLIFVQNTMILRNQQKSKYGRLGFILMALVVRTQLVTGRFAAKGHPLFTLWCHRRRPVGGGPYLLKESSPSDQNRQVLRGPLGRY